MSYYLKRFALCLALSLVISTNYAATWQVGIVAESSHSPFIKMQRETNVLPLVNYIGDKFSFVAGEVQYVLSVKENSETYITIQPRSRQFYSMSLNSNDDLEAEGMESRHSAVELGVGLKRQSTWGQVVVEGLIDVTGAHEGYELSATYSYPKKMGRWLIEPSFGLQLQSRDLVNYYHGVRSSEAQLNRPAYAGQQATNTLTSLMAGYTISHQLLALVGTELLVLDTSITNSPIVDEKKVQKTYLGLIYTF